MDSIIELKIEDATAALETQRGIEREYLCREREEREDLTAKYITEGSDGIWWT